MTSNLDCGCLIKLLGYNKLCDVKSIEDIEKRYKWFSVIIHHDTVTESIAKEALDNKARQAKLILTSIVNGKSLPISTVHSCQLLTNMRYTLSAMKQRYNERKQATTIDSHYNINISPRRGSISSSCESVHTHVDNNKVINDQSTEAAETLDNESSYKTYHVLQTINTNQIIEYQGALNIQQENQALNTPKMSLTTLPEAITNGQQEGNLDDKETKSDSSEQEGLNAIKETVNRIQGYNIENNNTSDSQLNFETTIEKDVQVEGVDENIQARERGQNNSEWSRTAFISELQFAELLSNNSSETIKMATSTTAQATGEVSKRFTFRKDMEKILDHTWSRRKASFTVKWAGYSETTREKLEDIIYREDKVREYVKSITNSKKKNTLLKNHPEIGECFRTC